MRKTKPRRVEEGGGIIMNIIPLVLSENMFSSSKSDSKHFFLFEAFLASLLSTWV